MAFGPTQALCTNEHNCAVVFFNPSLEDGGMADAQFIDMSGLTKPQKPDGE